MTYQLPEPDAVAVHVHEVLDPHISVTCHVSGLRRPLVEGARLYAEDKVLAAYEAGRASRDEEVRDLKLEIEETRKVVKEIRQYAKLRASA